ncbi:MAG: SGNH/GDSL hydrolase N-terminal domain-containing protein [Eubacteriales bacterium]
MSSKGSHSTPRWGYRWMPLNQPFTLPKFVEMHAEHTAGGQVRFHTKLRTLRVRVCWGGSATHDHLTATSQCWFDVYVRPDGCVGNPHCYSTR